MDNPRNSSPPPPVPPPWPPAPLAPPGYAPSPSVRYAPVPSIPLGGQAVPNAVPPYPTGPPVYGAPEATILTVEPRSVAPAARAGAVVAIVAAAGVAASTFLPWVRVDIEGLGLRSGNGWTNVVGGTSWGPLLVFLAVVAALGAAPAVANVRSTSATVVAVVASATAVLVAVAQFVDVVRSHAGVDASPRYGVVALVASSLLLVLACVVIAGAGRPAKVSAPRAVGAVG